MRNQIKEIKRDFEWMSAFTGPFKRPKLKWYFGEIALGVPYFYPRRWVKPTQQMLIDSAIKDIAERKRWNEANEKYGNPLKKIPTIEELCEQKKNHQFAVPKKIGFDFVPMRWKTKWTDTDYRFESGPIWSFVFFKWQVGLTFQVEEMHHYWECWLYYTYSTDKTKSVEERIQEARKGFPCIWTTHRSGEDEETICYWDVILKKKYL